MKQKLIYLASPFTHKLKSIEKERYKKITEIAARLTEKYGYAKFLPITQSYNMAKYMPSLDGKFEQWASIDLFIVAQKADEVWVVLIDGWDKSVGVQAEIKCAKMNKKPIRYINPRTLTFVNLNNTFLLETFI